MEANLFYEGRKIPFRLLAKNNQGYKNLMKLATELSSGQREFTAFSDYLNAIALILPSEDWEPGMTLGSEVFIGVRPEDAGKEFDYPEFLYIQCVILRMQIARRFRCYMPSHKTFPCQRPLFVL